MNKQIEEIKKQINDTLRIYKISKAVIFGSTAKNLSTTDSDIDILIESPRELTLFKFIELENKLSSILNKKVDLVEYSMIKSQIKDKILSHQIVIYEKYSYS